MEHNIPIPENFSGEKFKEIYGDYPTSDMPGFIRVDESIVSLDDCVDTSLIINQRIKVAWEAADDWQESQFDTNSRISMLALMVDPNCSPERMAKIQANIVWGNVLWSYYKEVKDQILNGIDAQYDTSMVGPVPYSIWSIVSE
jgi:hypothetical protein